MPAALSPRARAAIVEQLRAAGCVFAEDEARLLVAEARTADEVDAAVARRVAGEPIEHILGWAEFCGLRIRVEPDVFVPRHRTELLAHHAIALTQQAADRRVVVVDLCCGSGAVGAAVAAACGPVEIHAVDLDPAAVRCARLNLAGGDGHVYQGDLDEPLPDSLRGRVDVLVANAPYVPTAAVGLLPPEARLHEPRTALDGGADGLDIVRRVIVAAPPWLAPGGHLLIETSDDQAPEAANAMARCGLDPRVVGSPDLDATVVIGTRPTLA